MPIAYLATYTAAGKLTSITQLASTADNSAITYKAVLPTAPYKLFILDQNNNYAPVIVAYDGT